MVVTWWIVAFLPSVRGVYNIYLCEADLTENLSDYVRFLWVFFLLLKPFILQVLRVIIYSQTYKAEMLILFWKVKHYIYKVKYLKNSDSLEFANLKGCKNK